jgi:hypothetical protein
MSGDYAKRTRQGEIIISGNQNGSKYLDSVRKSHIINKIIYKCVLMNEWPRDMISEIFSRVISGNQCVV